MILCKMRTITVVCFLAALTALASGAAWDLSNSILQGFQLKGNLLVTKCSSDNGRPLVRGAFNATEEKDVIQEPSKNLSRVQCISNDPVMKTALRLTIYQSDDDAVTHQSDRQRMEIQTPLKHRGRVDMTANNGSTFVYAWWFQLGRTVKAPTGKSGFFHIFQIKSDVEKTDPLVTLTIRPSEKVSLRVHNAAKPPGNHDDPKFEELANLNQVAGVWTQAYVKVYFHKTSGFIEVTLKNSKGLNVQKTVKPHPTFWNSPTKYYRAKWGLYRSRSSSYAKNDTLLLQNVQIRGKP